MKSHPNIILCTCDQLRAFEVGCYGNDVIRTPNVDRLAAEGVRFATAVTNFPICMAARSVLLSGQYNRTCTGGVANVAYPSRPGDFNLPEYPQAGRPHLKDPTLAEQLHSQGYRTSVIGKWHIHSWPHEVGFDDYLIPRVHHCHTGQSYTQNGGPEFVPAAYSVDFEAERVEQFLGEQRSKTTPFFLYYNISPPHCPIADAPQKYRTMYRPDDMPVRPNVRLDRPLKDQDYWFKVYRWDFRFYSLHLPYTEQLPESYSLRHLMAEYYGMTTWMDVALGRMLNALDAAGLAEDTFVVFTSDHGDNLGSHGLVQKGSFNEEAIRVPLIVRGPGMGAVPRAALSHVASLVDLAPTLLSLAGGQIPAHMHGRDLTPILRGEDNELETCAFVETQDGVAIRTARYVYVLPFAGKDHVLGNVPAQFFDLDTDPYELRNLAGQGEMVETARQLDTRLRAWDAGIPFATLQHD